MFSKPKLKDSQRNNFKKICGDFLKAEKSKSEFAKARCLATEEALKLYELLKDPIFGIDYTDLLCRDHPTILSPGSWADVAKISIEHARLVFNDNNISTKIFEAGFLHIIAEDRPLHARLILEKFGNQLDEDSKKIAEFYSKERLRTSIR